MLLIITKIINKEQMIFNLRENLVYVQVFVKSKKLMVKVNILENSNDYIFLFFLIIL